MKKTEPLEITKTVTKGLGITVGVPFTAYVWPTKKTIVLVPPRSIKLGIKHVNLAYISEILAEIFAGMQEELGIKMVLIKLIPIKWKVFVCHLGTNSSVNIERNDTIFTMKSPSSIRSKDIRAFVEEEVERQLKEGF